MGVSGARDGGREGQRDEGREGKSVSFPRLELWAKGLRSDPV